MGTGLFIYDLTMTQIKDHGEKFDLVHYKSEWIRNNTVFMLVGREKIICISKFTIAALAARKPLMRIENVIKLSLGKAAKSFATNEETQSHPHHQFFSIHDSDGSELIFKTTKKAQRKKVVEAIIVSLEHHRAHRDVIFDKLRKDVEHASKNKVATFELDDFLKVLTKEARLHREREDSATSIRASWRGYQVRKEINQKRVSATRIQTNWRKHRKNKLRRSKTCTVQKRTFY